MVKILLFGDQKYAVTYLGHLGDWYTSLGAQTHVPKKHFQSFLFSVELSIIDFTMHLIISKWFRIQNCRKNSKQGDKEVKAKEETVNESGFIHLAI